jgi:U3 small nucleolar RNA-associated protein 23
MRHLYKAASEPGVSYLIDKAKLYERRRCGHRPDEFPEPLSAKECIESVVDPKGAKHNKHRYVVASQDIEVRKAMRKVEGVPLVYINRSVMIMEPMAGATEQVRDRDEKLKFRDGLKRGSGSSGMKRKREDEGDELKKADGATGSEAATKKRKAFGAPKGPNPLSVKKAKKVVDGDKAAKKLVKEENSGKAQAAPGEDGAAETEGKRKRRRKHKSGAGGGDGDGDGHVTSEGAVAETVDVVASDEA